MDYFLSSSTSALFFIIIAPIVIIFIFLILRWLVLWYWRIDEAVDSLSNIAINLANINNSLEKLTERKGDKNKDLSDTLVKIKEENDLEK